MNYTKISRELLESLTFRPFTKNDWYGFQGCESPVPMIADLESEGIMVVIDGDYVELYADQGIGNFECIDTCDSIRTLPAKSARQVAIEAEIAKMEAALAELKNELCY